MLLQELIGKKITNIFQMLEYEHYGMDKGECFIELDNKIIIEIPNSFADEVRTKELDEKAVSIFDDLSDYPVYRINKEDKSIKEVVDKYADKKQTLFEIVVHSLLGRKPAKQQKRIV